VVLSSTGSIDLFHQSRLVGLVHYLVPKYGCGVCIVLVWRQCKLSIAVPSQGKKEKVKVKVTLEQATKAQRGTDVTLLFLQPLRYMGWVITARPGRFTLGKDPVPII